MIDAGSRVRTGILALGIILAIASDAGTAPASVPAQAAETRDGQGDFDFEFGRWRTVVRRLKNPLSGAADWATYEGTSVVHALLGNRANLVELSIEGPTGRIEGVSLRLYHPETRQWSLHYASAANGELTKPLFGRFENGRGEFYGEDDYAGRPIRVRFIITEVTANSVRFEQAFSADGGKTWEVNWIATDTRIFKRSWHTPN